MARTRNSKDNTPLLAGLDERSLRRRPRKARSISSKAGVRKSSSKDQNDKSDKLRQLEEADVVSSSAIKDEAHPGPPENGVTTEHPAPTENGVTSEATEALIAAPLARIDNTRSCTFKEQDAELTVKLEVNHARSEPIHLLSYTAQLLLTRREGDSETTADIGRIFALRVDKATKTHPNPAIADIWRQNLIKPKIAKIPEDLQELARCIKALHTESGFLRIKGLSAAVRDVFADNSLLFIQKIYIRPDFARQGLLRHALAGFEAAVAQLPEWFAFAGTVLLVPAQPEGEEGAAWGDMELKAIYETLRDAYSRHGFELWIDQTIQDGRSLETIPVMGKTIPVEA